MNGGYGAALGAPRPEAAWEGWFFIFVGGGGRVRWAKSHLFLSRPIPGWHPISAVEGLVAPGEAVALIAEEGAVHRARFELDRREVQSSREAPSSPAGPIGPSEVEGRAEFERSPLSVAAPERFRLSEEPSRLLASAGGERCGFEVELLGCEPVKWIGLGGLLSYGGAFGAARGAFGIGGESVASSGLGMVEHAFGGRVPFDPARRAPERWHWDVLVFEGDTAALMVLSIRLPVLGWRVIRSRGRLPEAEAASPSGAVEYLELASEGAATYPRRWRGTVNSRRGALRYEARAATPIAPVAPGGGFLGFDFEAGWTARGGRERALKGRGFCECGGSGAAKLG
ncbi:MAG: hypothetical protein HYZ28_20670 [Myxococcales bacterium]|nr:hypothetical protein [Myxococcales bacterium]